MSTEQSHRFRYPHPVLFLYQTLFSQVVGLREGRGRVPERASTQHVREAVETLPNCILPHRAGFQRFFKAADEILATVEKLTKSFHTMYMILFLSLSFLPLKRKTQKNLSDLCKWEYANRVASFALGFMKDNLWPYTHTHTHTHISWASNRTLFIWQINIIFSLKKKKEQVSLGASL